MKGFHINIIGLSTKVHHFDFRLDDLFFKEYATELLSGGSFQATVDVDKHETFIEADFQISGDARLVCDRTLEPFDFPVRLHQKMMFKYGLEAGEVSDEITIISRDQASIDAGQYMYEFISLQLPMKKLHPRFKEEEIEGDGKIVYQSASEEEPTTDPRWEALKKLK